MIQPRAAIISGGTLFHEGSFLTPDGHYCYSESTFNIAPWQQRHHRAVLRHLDEETEEGLIRPYPRTMAVSGRCFSTLSNTTHNYGHFIHDVLSRIHYEDLGLIAPGRDRIIAPNFRFPMQEALFRHIFEGYEIVAVPDGTALEVEELVVPANLCDSTAFNPKGVAAIRPRLRKALAQYISADAAHKVCVSRSDGKASGGRNFMNMDAYEAHMAKAGYTVIEASSLGLEDQFRLWCNTSDIVGIHGAGMMNMIMMPAGRYTEITPHPKGPIYTVRCAMAAGHNVAGYTAAPGPEGQSVIDLGQLDSILKAR